MILSKEVLKDIDPRKVIVPNDTVFSLPEKVLQFGTGVLLRGLPDYFIDKANRQGIFNGRVVVVKSTGNDTSEFDQQDSLYTIGIRGVDAGQNVEENMISSAISRVISAEKDWAAVLKLAGTPALQIVVSNTTEVGIQLVDEQIDQQPPSSFPAKLLSVLYERYQILKAAPDAGLIIIATELIPDNGQKLESIVYELAAINQLPDDFVNWSRINNIFCNSLVDRIVPGKPDAARLVELQQELGYTDSLLILAEPYRLWAVEGNDKVAGVLSFMATDSGLIVKEDIEIYRELKVRLLNGTHTLSSGIACLAGIKTVKEGMDNVDLHHFVEQAMQQEIVSAIPYPVDREVAIAFAGTVIDRFANPHIKHLWLSITMQYSMKLKIRVLPVLFNYYSLFGSLPPYITFGFAAYLHFMRVHRMAEGKFYGQYDGNDYLITDDSAAYFYDQTQTHKDEGYPGAVLTDTAFWNADLDSLPGFISAVTQYYSEIRTKGIITALRELKINSQTDKLA
jgi:tagaturonate reductase